MTANRAAAGRRSGATGGDGFTLVELMVVVLIIGILVAIAVPKFTNAQKGARARTAQENVRSAETIMSTVYADKSSYEPIDQALLTKSDPVLYPPTDTVGQPSNNPGQISWSYVKAGSATVSPLGAEGFVVGARSTGGNCYLIKIDGPSRQFGQKATPAAGGCIATTTPDVNAKTGAAWAADVDAQWA